MKRLATGLLVLMAVIFVISFALQDEYPWLQYVRAASEGGMVGALADWFAVTALFRHPLGIPIPHTAIIRTKKDEIGQSLGQFVEENFLSGDIVRGKLDSIGVSRHAGRWLAQPDNARRLGDETAAAVRGAITLLDDSDVQDVIEALARKHLLDPPWGPPLGSLMGGIVAAGHHTMLVDTLVDQAEAWLARNPESFARMVSSRMPTWLPSFVGSLVDDRLYREALGFVRAVRAEPSHPLRVALDGYLVTLAHDLATDPELITRVEEIKNNVFDSPRVRSLATDAWESTKTSLLSAMDDPGSPLRASLESIVIDLGRRLESESSLAGKVDRWVGTVAAHLVDRYRGDIASIITETIGRWDPRETAEKLELQVGKDLQFIRINGTVVGSLAGLAIFTVAHAIFGR
ncbi:DUF445 domain-containing protein [Microbacteriaceae bacterium VKM Ac-2855]|nr:DUF445 domain-containing protein [Microbacteriaceae bacterium VKM Ac-2855]